MAPPGRPEDTCSSSTAAGRNGTSPVELLNGADYEVWTQLGSKKSGLLRREPFLSHNQHDLAILGVRTVPPDLYKQP